MGTPLIAAGAALLVGAPLVAAVPIIAATESAAQVMCLPQNDTGLHLDGDNAGQSETITAADLAPFTTKKLGAALAGLPPARNSERRLQGNTVLVLRLLENLFPYYRNGGVIGGWREDAINDHPSGQALDIMLKDDGRTDSSVAAGNEIAAFLEANEKALGVDYMMFRHRIGLYGSEKGWRQAKEYGSWVDNHMNHIHLKVKGDHVPTGTLKLPKGSSFALPTPAPATPAVRAMAATPAPAAAGTVVWPVGKGQMGGLHPTGARDMGRSLGTPVVAAHDGVVTESADLPPDGRIDSGGYGSYGRYVTIAWKDSSGRWMGNLYGHMRSRSVQAGQKVQAGQLVGYVGSTGQSTGPHLHFEYFTTGASQSGSKTGLDPEPWLRTGIETATDNLPADPSGEVTADECEAAGGITEELPEFGGSGPYTDSAETMQPIGTFYSATEAAQRLVRWAKEGKYYDGLCLALTDDAYGPKGDRSGTAIEQWYKAKRAGVAHPGDRNPPIGAQLYWWSSNPARHVATYIGGGKVVSNIAAHGGKVEIVDASYLDGYGPYLGWAVPYYK